MSDKECEVLVGQAERAIEEIGNTLTADGCCSSHPAMGRVQILTLQMLIPLYRKASNGSAGVREILKGSPLAIVIGILPTPFLLFVWLIGRGKGWW